MTKLQYERKIRRTSKQKKRMGQARLGQARLGQALAMARKTSEIIGRRRNKQTQPDRHILNATEEETNKK